MMPEHGFSTPSPMIPHDAVPFEYNSRHQPPYRHSIATPEYPYHPEPTPPESQSSSTSPVAPTPPSNTEPITTGKKEKSKKDKDRGKGKPERQYLCNLSE